MIFRPAIRRSAGMAAAATLLLLGGCASLNPFTSADARPRPAPPPNTDARIPNLASVPARPAPADRGERDRLTQGLAADRANAQYTDEVFRRVAEAPPPPRDFGIQPPADTRPGVPAAPPPRPTQVIEQPPPRAAAPVARPIDTAEPPVVARASGAIDPAPGFLPNRPAPVAPAVDRPPPAPVVRDPLPTAPPPPATVPDPTAPPGESAASRRLDDMLREGFPGIAAAPATVGGLTSAALIYFPAGSAALADTDRVLLGELARAVQGLSSALLVAGHAAREGVADDQGGQRAAMRALSQARAEAVRRELLRQGVAADRVRVEAFGDERPDFDESRPTGIAGNRRVEVLIAP